MLWVRRSMRSMRSMQKASSLIAVIVGWSNNYESLRLLLSLCLLQRLLLSLCLLQRLLLSLCPLQRLLLSLCLLQRLLLSLLLGFPSYFFGLPCRFLGVLGLLLGLLLGSLLTILLLPYHGTRCWGLFFLHHYRFGLLLCNSRSSDWELLLDWRRVLLDWRRVLLDWCCIRYRLGLHCQRIHCLFMGVLRRTWCFDGPKGRSRRHYLLLVRSVRGV